MKKIILVLAVMIGLTSFNSSKKFPCHPLGDLYPCTHPMHPLGDLGICTHSYIDNWGNTCFVHPAGDLYPCTHPVHYRGDLYPCTHICY